MSQAEQAQAGGDDAASGAETMAMDAVSLLEADHRTVELLFAEFEAAAGDADKRRLANLICVALKVHARLEEEIFYPAAALALDRPQLIEQALVEHASAKDLIAQIEASAPGERMFDAKVKVLSEYVAHHVAEEEAEIFAQCRGGQVDLDALGLLLTVRKLELTTGFTVSNPILALD